MDEKSKKDETGRAMQKPWEFKPGTSGNPAGRPMAARQKLGEKFIAVLQADFDVHGVEIVRQLRENDPARYMQIVANLMPKALEIAIQQQMPLPSLSVDDNIALRSLLDVIERVGTEEEPGRVFEDIERYLRMERGPVIEGYVSKSASNAPIDDEKDQ
jgi:hypothetical protein